MKTHYAYYNEFDKSAAEWLRNLIKRNLIMPGLVDDRPIQEVSPADLKDFTQCHFFAGIGVWSYALRLAGWDDETPVWTGSCPCQPFSSAGKQIGFDDERHLWPTWFELIKECRPPTIFGEQVASKDAEPWIDLVQSNLETLDYAVGAVAFPSAGVGAPHIRDRLYWVGNADSEGLEGHGRHGDHGTKPGRDGAEPGRSVTTSGTTIGMAHTNSDRCFETRASFGKKRGNGAVRDNGVVAGSTMPGPTIGMADPEYHGCGRSENNSSEPRGDRSHVGLSDRRHIAPSWMADAFNRAGLPGESRAVIGEFPKGVRAMQTERHAGPTNGFWRASDWLYCRDNKWRPVEPGTFPLAHGATSRVVRLRAYGNAINAYAAKTFIESFIEARNDLDDDI